jgi:hypothetical protein
MPLIPARFRRPDPAVVKREAIRKDIVTLQKAMQGIGAGTSGSGAGAMGPVMPGSQFQGGWNNLGNASMAMLQRVTANMARQHEVPVAEIEQQLIEAGMTWGPPFPPGRPLDPFFGWRRAPRTWDYTVGENVQLTPRWSRISFQTIKAIYEAYDVAQVCVRHLINDVRSLDYDWVPISGERDDVSGDIETARQFFSYPDKAQPFRNWLAEYLQDVLRYDAGTLYCRRTEAGEPYALEVVSGATMIPLIDFYGRVAADRDDTDTPMPEVWPGGDTPGFMQIIEGMPWTWHTIDDIIYQPWNPLPESQYGLAPLEAILLTANTDIRFQQHFLDYFTQGSLPAGFMEAPQDLSDPSLIAELQETWDALMVGDQEMLRRIRFVPFGSKFTPVKNSDFDEAFPLYLMRRVCAAYGITPANLGFTETVNRATSDTQVDIQWRVGTLPLVRHVEDVLNLFVSKHLGLRCQIQFDKGQEIEDRLMTMQAHQGYVDMGAISVDEVRAELGKPIDRSRPIPRMINNARLGPIPLIAIESMSGKIDEETYAPDARQQLVSNPYIGSPGVIPAHGSPEEKAAAAANAQMQRELLQATTGQQPSAAMQQAIAAASPAPPGAPSKGPEGTTAQPSEVPPAQGAGSSPVPSEAAQTASKPKTAKSGVVKLGGEGAGQSAFTANSGIQGNPLTSGSGEDDEEDDTSELYGFNEEWKAAKSLDALLDLRRWREKARNDLRKGQPLRRFRSTAIPSDVQALIWSRLEKAESRREVNAIFADVVSGRPFRYQPRSRIGSPQGRR